LIELSLFVLKFCVNKKYHVELEVRWLLDTHWSATLAASLARTVIKGPDRSFAYVPARNLGTAPQDGFGGSYIVYDFSSLKGAGDYDNSLMPKAVVSPALAYTDGDWGAVLAATYVGQTRQTVPDPVVFPSYVTLNASVFIRWDGWKAAVNLDNALDARFFTPDADIYAVYMPQHQTAARVVAFVDFLAESLGKFTSA
jgi:iron complex outermembrane receptor protein